jgi:hypothetical protein
MPVPEAKTIIEIKKTLTYVVREYRVRIHRGPMYAHARTLTLTKSNKTQNSSYIHNCNMRMQMYINICNP